MHNLKSKDLNNDYELIQEAKRNNQIFQAVADILNEFVTKRDIYENFSALKRDETIKVLAEYDSLLYDIQEIMPGIMGVLGTDEAALDRANAVINQLKEM